MSNKNVNQNMIEFLIEKNCKMDKEDNELYTPAHYALMCIEDTELLKYIINMEGVDLKKENIMQETVLHIAARYNSNIGIISYLIDEKQCKIYLEYGDENTPLHLACLNKTQNNLEIVKLFSEKYKCDLNRENFEKENSLSFAVNWADNLEIIKYLYFSPSIHVDQNNLLEKACYNYNGEKKVFEVCKFLIEEQKIDVNIINNEGVPCYFYSFSHDLNLAKLFIENKADLKLLDKTSKNFLFYASRYCKSLDVLKYLCGLQIVNYYCADQNGENPLFVACFRNINFQIVRYLLRKNYFFTDSFHYNPIKALLKRTDFTPLQKKEALILSICHGLVFSRKFTNFLKREKDPILSTFLEDFQNQNWWNVNDHKYFSKFIRMQIESFLNCLKFLSKEKIIFKLPKPINLMIFKRLVHQTTIKTKTNKETKKRKRKKEN